MITPWLGSLRVPLAICSLVAVAFLQVSAAPPSTPPPPSCGYESCPSVKEDAINLHLVPHTHDDVGWLKTYDQYYYGGRNKIQDAGVQYIIDSVVQELSLDPKKRFIYVETAFFWKWWKDQNDHTRHLVKHLVSTGRLEIIGGGWSMNDEATTHYQSIIDQFAWGFRRLESALGPCGRPRIGWQIDPFGHSKENAAIMAKLGFDALFLGRIDWEDKMHRLRNKSMEVIWYTDPYVPGNDGKLFTGVLYNTYSAPKGFCFDINCQDEPIIDNKESPDYNAYQRAAEFLRMMDNYTKAYRSKNVLVTMGDDFMYQSAHVNFKNMDKLIEQINSQSTKYNALYSTPSCYLKAVHDEGLSFPIKEDDYMPYSSDPYSFWSGYFSSRPTIKRFERIGNNFAQIVKQMSSVTGLGDTKELNALREAMGVMQHHDAVTGTEKQHVASDYSRILTSAIDRSHAVLEEALAKVMKQRDAVPVIESCLLLNISSCKTTEESSMFVVSVYNPLSWPVNHLVRVPVASDDVTYIVTGPDGKEVESQILIVPQAVKNLPGRPTSSGFELAWLAEKVSPVGHTSYHVTKSSQWRQYQRSYRIPFNSKSMTIGYSEASITLNSNGELKGIKMGSKVFGANQAYYYYYPAVGNNKVYFNRSSGAYIFRPNGSEYPLNSPEIKIFKGPIVTEVHHTYNDWVSQIIRTVKGSNAIQFEWLVGPIPIEEERGKEIIWRFAKPDMKTDGVFKTDSNGRQHLLRKLFHRDDWPVHLAEKVPGNYYPITTDISISDNKERITVVTDRAQGGSSLCDGEVELMVHRRLTHDDAFGVEEALNETAFGEGLVARGSLWLVSGSDDEARQTVQEKSVLAPWLFISPTSYSYSKWKDNFKMEFSSLSTPLPKSVQILTLEPWTHGDILLRLEHISVEEDEVTIGLENLFTSFKVIGVQEMTIDGMKPKSTVSRFEWNEELGNTIVASAPTYQPASLNVTMKTMQIRTFILKVTYYL